MNVYLFIFAAVFNENLLMARKVDEEKLVRIKQATMKTIVDCGIEKTTIAMIAKNANVSGGYLYRLYSGKQALIDELYFEKIVSLNNELDFLIGLNKTSVAAILKAFIHNRIIYAQNEPDASKFFSQLLHNNNFTVSGKLKEKSISLIKSIKQIGENTGEISKNINLAQIQYHLFNYVVDYIHFKRKNMFDFNDPTTNDADYLADNILTIFKKGN